ncbi:MAG: PAS domain S-box protein [Bacteroidales bacterium]|nr:PAS domain S-box protein [Bacteroidales bacterium]
MKTEFGTQLLKGFIELSQDLICVVDWDGYFKYTNPAWKKILGYSKKELLAKPIINFIHPDDHNLYKDNIISLEKGEISSNIELKHIHKDGSERHIQWTRTPIPDKKLLQCIGRDISKIKLVQDTLNDSEEKFSKIFYYHPMPMQIINVQTGEMIDVNKSYLELTGYTFAKLGKGNIYIENIAANQNRLIELTNKIKKEGSISNEYFQILSKSGETKTTLVSTVKIDTNKGRMDIISLLDITENEKAQKLLKNSEEKFSKTFYYHPTPMQIINVQTGEKLDVNKSFMELTGYPSFKSAIGNVYLDNLAVDKDRLIELTNKIKKEGSISNEYFQILSKSDEIKSTLVSTVKIGTNKGRIDIISLLDITENEKAQKLLKNSEEKYKLLSNLTFEGIIIHKEGIAIDVNSSFINMFGYTRDEIIGKNVIGLMIPKEYHLLVSENIIIEHTKPYEVEGIKKDGSRFPIELEGKNIKTEEDGRISRVVAVRDITEQKRAEKEIIETKNKLSDAQRVAKLGGWELNINTQIITHSPEFNFLLGEEPQKTSLPLFRYVEKYVTPDDIATIKKHFELAKRNINNTSYSDSFEYRLKTKNGTIQYLAVKAHIKTKGILTGVTQDITEVVETNQKLKTHNLRLEGITKILKNNFETTKKMLDYALSYAIKLTESKIGYIYFYDEDTKQFTLNTWSGKVLDECKVTDPHTLYDLEKTGCWGEAVRQHQSFVMNDYSKPNKYKKGTPKGHVQLKTFLTVPVIINDEVKAVVGVANKEGDYSNFDEKQLSLLMDAVWRIVEQNQYQEKLIIAKEKAEESDRLKSAFLTNMSHEIRTPMNSIIGFSSLLKDPTLTGEDQKEYIEIIERGGKRMLSTINDIIDIAKIESGQETITISKVNINEKMEMIYSFFKMDAEKKGLVLSYKNGLSNSKSIIESDREKIYSILLNLVKNAIKYTQEGEVEFGYQLKKNNGLNELEFYINDTGCGIPKDRHEAIFDRFVQADIEDKLALEGSGLGLSISKSYVEMHGGKIWLKSKIDIGSQFYFTIPTISPKNLK